MTPRTLAATRYVTPLREGGSLPAIVEGDDAGLYVLKFRGAGQGPKALIAEWVAGELARAAGLDVPEIVRLEVDADLARSEPDPEIQDLIRASAGLNLGLDYLPGAAAFDPVAEAPAAALASRIVWFDAYVTNIDRSPRNTNLLVWHGRTWLIDHGAALYFHHGAGDWMERAADPFTQVKDHVLLPFAAALDEADQHMALAITPEGIRRIVAAIPGEWLEDGAAFGNVGEHRDAYARYLVRRLAMRRVFVDEAKRARG